jgi:type IV pilus assembly protein PilO
VKRPLTKNVKLALGGVGFAVLALAAYLLIVAPQRSKASDLQRQVESAKSQLASLEAAAKAARPDQRVRVADVFRLAKAMPTKPDVPDILLELNRVSADTGVDFQSITPSTPTPSVGYTVVPISLVFQGNYYNLNDFLFRLRNLVHVSGGKLDAEGRLYNVASISFAEGKNKFPQVQATLTVNAYVYGGAPAAPAVPATGTTSTSTTTTPTTTTTPSTPAASPTAAAAPGAMH